MEKNFGRMEIQSTKTNAVAFPRLLKRLCDDVCPCNEASEKIKSGFKKCGIFPLDAQPVLERLPVSVSNPQNRTENDSATVVSNAFIELLESMRSPPDTQR